MIPPPFLAVDVDGVISLFGFDTPPPASTVAWHLIDGTPHCISLAAGERLSRLSSSFELVWATGWQERANDRLPQVIGIGPLPVVEFDLPANPGEAGVAETPPPDEATTHKARGRDDGSSDGPSVAEGSRPVAEGPLAATSPHTAEGSRTVAKGPLAADSPLTAEGSPAAGSSPAAVGSLAGHWKLEALGRFAGDRAIAWIDDSLDESCFDWAERREAAGLPTLLAPTEPGIGIEEAHVAALESWAAGLDLRPESSP